MYKYLSFRSSLERSLQTLGMLQACSSMGMERSQSPQSLKELIWKGTTEKFDPKDSSINPLLLLYGHYQFCQPYLSTYFFFFFTLVKSLILYHCGLSNRIGNVNLQLATLKKEVWQRISISLAILYFVTLVCPTSYMTDNRNCKQKVTDILTIYYNFVHIFSYAWLSFFCAISYNWHELLT